MKSVKISFLGNEYLVKTDADEDYVKQIANYMEEIVRDTSPNLGSIKIPLPLFLSTLKIADDLFRLKSEYEEYKSSAEEKTRRLVAMFDDALGETDPTEIGSGGETESEEDQRKPGTFKSWS
ncbi:MAG: cell division protein ZapA [Thermodesulfobacteriota bacterium]